MGLGICPWCPLSAYPVMPEKLPVWEGSDVGVMGEDGWERHKYSWPVGKHWERQAGGKQMSVF